MSYSSFLYSPLEQFVVQPLFIPILTSVLGLTFTNQLLLLFLILFFFAVLFSALVSPKNATLFLVPNHWQSLFESIGSLVSSLVFDNIKDDKASKFLPLIYCIFLFILSLNMFGLVPYSFTLTSHIIVTFALALVIFFAINVVGIRKHGIHFFSLFLPPGTSIVLSLLLVPIELISYVFKPISLSIRLFANMMAGHTLLKVIGGFGFTLMGLGGGLFFLHYVPLMILIPLLALELGVAFIQTFVFSILICIYLNDAHNLH
jgi:ATP synthase subunit 6